MIFPRPHRPFNMDHLRRGRLAAAGCFGFIFIMFVALLLCCAPHTDPTLLTDSASL